MSMRIAFTFVVAVGGCRGTGAPEDTIEEAACGEVPACPDGYSVEGEGVRLGAEIEVPHGPTSIAVGDAAGLGYPQVYVGTTAGVTRLAGAGWTEVLEVWSQPGDGRGTRPAVGDLTGDGLPDLVIGLPGSDGGAGQVVVFPGPVAGPVDWSTPHTEVKGTGGVGDFVAVRDFDGDGGPDLIASADNAAWFKFGPITEDSVLDDTIDSMWSSVGDWVLTVAATGDFDADGVGDVALTNVATGECAPVLAPRVALGPVGPDTGPAEVLEVAAPESYPLERVALWGAASSPSTHVVGDINDDGLDDLVGWGMAEDGSAEGIASPAPFDSFWRFSIPGPPIGVADFDGDGIADLLVQAVDAPAIIAGPILDLPTIDGGACDFAVEQVWETQSTMKPFEARWVGDIDGDGLGDAVLAGSRADGNDSGFVVTALSVTR